MPCVRSVFVLVPILSLAACGAPSIGPAAAAGDSVVYENARLPGRTETLEIRVANGLITDVGGSVPRAARRVNLSGNVVLPQVIDSHVHLAFLPRAAELAAAGVAATVDLGAPRESLSNASSRALMSGPMLTTPAGYPTQGWGRDGYGKEVALEDARAAVDALADDGAALIKVPLPDAGGVGGQLLDAITARAHERGLRVVGHALSAADVAVAAAAGLDVLAHAPLEPLSPNLVRDWAPRPVISTLSAFSAELSAQNLRALADAGSPVLYGTDFGNTRVAGISRDEIAAMESAGMSGEEIIQSMTGAPSTFWRIDVGRAIEPGAPGCLMTVAGDPLTNPQTLAAPLWVSPCS